jgi:hypothetical protein
MFMNVKVPREVVPVISFIAFTVMLVVGVNFFVRGKQNSVKSTNGRTVKKRVWIFVAGLFLYLIGTPIANWAMMKFTKPASVIEPIPNASGLAIPLIWVIGVPLAYSLYFARERLWALIVSILFLIMGGCAVVAPLTDMRNPFTRMWDDYATLTFGIFVLLVFPILWMAIILLSPLQHLARRLAFVVLGVLILIGLSEISKLNLHQYLKPATVSDNSVR